uniref:Uncharacterized protein n=1 Tax=Angiostrongylus cantonensis TaxID=6313 RepID=A0A0K0DKC9_ANGCA
MSGRTGISKRPLADLGCGALKQNISLRKKCSDIHAAHFTLVMCTTVFRAANYIRGLLVFYFQTPLKCYRVIVVVHYNFRILEL